MNLPNHRTCVALCDDPAASPLGLGNTLVTNIARQYQGWSTSGADPLDSSKLQEEILMDVGARMTGGIGVFVASPGCVGGRLQILHSLHKHPGPANRGTIYACRGDVLDVDVDIVEFDPDSLDITAESRVADDADCLQELCDAAPDIELVPAFAAQAARTRLAKTRKSVCVPTPLLPHVLEQPLTAREAFETLLPVIQDLGLETAAAPLVDFLLVAATQTGAAPNLSTTVRPDTVGTSQGAREITQDRRENLLCRHLPALRPSATPQSDPALLGMMNCMRDQRNASLADLNERRLEREKAKAPQTVEDRWPAFIDRLCSLCAVDEWEDSPACWHAAAAWKRGSGTTLRSVLDEATRVAARDLGVNPPQIAVQHSNSLQNWPLIGPTIYCIGNGIVPVSVTPPNAVSLKAKRRVALDCEQAADDATMVQGNGNITSADARALRTGAHVPVNFDEVEASPEACGAMLGALLGTNHALVPQCFESLKACGRVRQQLKQTTSRRFGEPPAAATLAHHCHVNLCCWFEDQWNQDAPETVPPPPFSEGFRSFARGNNLSWLPDTTLVEPFGSLQPEPVDERPSHDARPAAGARTSSPAPARTARERARNRNRDTRHIGENPLAVRIRKTTVRDAIARGGTPPAAGDGAERCLSWHLKGNCFADCPRKADHTVLQGEEKESSFNWELGRQHPHPRVAVPLARPERTRHTDPRSGSDTNPEVSKINGQVIAPEPGEPVDRNRRASSALERPGATKPRHCAKAFIPRHPPSPPRVTTSATAPVARRPPAAPASRITHSTTDPTAGQPRDEPEQLIDQAVARFKRATDWDEFFDLQRDPRGDWGDVHAPDHPAAHLLHHHKTKGAPVKMTTEPWSESRRQAATRRGPHKSAKEHRQFLREEHTAMTKKGHWAVLPAKLPKGLPMLRLSPLGVAPQRERRPRAISDCSHFGINQDTLRLAPPDAMQFGRALQRVLQKTFDANPRCGPVCLAKIDIADGFCRMGLRPSDALKLAVLFPTAAGEEALVGIPLTLPMGWAESPPAFCTAAETIADLANREPDEDPKLERQESHRLDQMAETKCGEDCADGKSDRIDRLDPSDSRAEDRSRNQSKSNPTGASSAARSAEKRHFASNASANPSKFTNFGFARANSTEPSAQTAAHAVAVSQKARGGIAKDTKTPSDHGHRKRLHKPLRHWDVHVDDFLGLTQGSPSTRKRVKRTILRALDQVFRPLAPTDDPHRQEPASIKKPKKGDATWATRKTMLGWIIDTESETIELPEHRKERLKDTLRDIRPGQRCIATKQWHKVLGELRSMAMAIPGARGMFSVLQEAFRHEDTPRARLRPTKAAHAFVNDFRWMASEIAARPTRTAELIPTPPAVVGSCDAAGDGMGGVFFLPTDTDPTPHLWRARFPTDVQNALVSCANPKGTITNSDLELCGNMAHHDATAQTADIRERTIWTASDNTANVHWNRKGSTATAGPPAYQALARMPANTRTAFISDLGAVEEAIVHGVCTKTGQQKDKHWEMWTTCCLECGIDPFLRAHQDPVPFLSVFAHRCRTGCINPSKRTVRAPAASAALCSVGQTLMRMGTKDPRLTAAGKQDFRLTRQLQSCVKADPPPSRVRPAPITLASFLLRIACDPTHPQMESECAMADVTCIAFHFLLRPGEHTGATNDEAAFSLADVRLHLGSRKLILASSPTRELEAATSVSLCFTTQKSQRKGDATAHGRSTHPLCCPVRSTVRMILRHRAHFTARSPPFDDTQKLATHCHRNARCAIKATDVTRTLRFAADACFHTTGPASKDISARSLRAGGAMALLCGDVDSDTIKLLGRWHSDAMMRCLHQDADPVKRRSARRMHNNGRHSFLPSHTVPSRPAPAVAITTAPAPPTPPPPAPTAPATPMAPPAPRRSRRLRGIAPDPLPTNIPRQLRPRNLSPR